MKTFYIPLRIITHTSDKYFITFVAFFIFNQLNLDAAKTEAVLLAGVPRNRIDFSPASRALQPTERQDRISDEFNPS